MSTEQNKATIRRWFDEAWNNGNFASAGEMYSTNYILHDPSGPVPSPEGLTQLITAYRTGFPDLHVSIEDMVAEEDKVASRFIVRGTHKGELMGIPPTGKQVTVSSILISRFADGKWAEDWANYDALGMMQQIGALPTPG
jgi:steroid delta-isomerase-like uncharacterized protein